MSEHYLYRLDLPFCNKKITYRELQSIDQLSLCKINSMSPFKKGFYADYGIALKEIIGGCVKNKEDFECLNLIDYFLFITKLRIISIGDEIELNLVANSEENSIGTLPEEIKKIKIILFLNKFIHNLYEISKDVFKDPVISPDYKFNIELDWPLMVFEDVFLSKIDNGEENIFFETLCLFVKKIKILDKDLKITDWTFEQLKDFFEKLPLSLTHIIQKKVMEAVSLLNTSNLFELPKENQIGFGLYNAEYQLAIRLFFTENLQHIYEEYFVLAEKNIFPDFLNKSTIAERKIFLSILEKERKMSKTSSKLIEY